MNEPVPTQNTRFDRLRRGSAFVGVGLLAGLIAAGVGGVASAQTVIAEPGEPAASTHIVRSALLQVDEGSPVEADEYEPSPEEEAVFERFDQCMEDAGVDMGVEDGTEGEAHDGAVELDDDAVDAAFEQCEPILEELGDEFLAEFGDFEELSAEDEAVFEQYDTCLESAGLNFDEEAADVEIDDAVFDAAFEQCDPILDRLSDEAIEIFGDFEELSAQDEAVFDRYDTCLETAGLDFDDESSFEIDEESFEALFEQCDQILDELSEEAQELFGECPEDDEE